MANRCCVQCLFVTPNEHQVAMGRGGLLLGLKVLWGIRNAWEHAAKVCGSENVVQKQAASFQSFDLWKSIGVSPSVGLNATFYCYPGSTIAPKIVLWEGSTPSFRYGPSVCFWAHLFPSVFFQYVHVVSHQDDAEIQRLVSSLTASGLNPSVIPRRSVLTARLCSLAWLSLTNAAGTWHLSHFVFITKDSKFSFGGQGTFCRPETVDDCTSFRWAAAWCFTKATINREEPQLLANSSITKYGYWFWAKLAFILGHQGFILSAPRSSPLHSSSHFDPLRTTTRPNH